MVVAPPGALVPVRVVVVAPAGVVVDPVRVAVVPVRVVVVPAGAVVVVPASVVVRQELGMNGTMLVLRTQLKQEVKEAVLSEDGSTSKSDASMP